MNLSLSEQRVIFIDITKIFVTLFHHTVACAVQQLFHNTMFLFKKFFFPDISSLQCYSVLTDFLGQMECCIPLDSESAVLSTGDLIV